MLTFPCPLRLMLRFLFMYWLFYFGNSHLLTYDGISEGTCVIKVIFLNKYTFISKPRSEEEQFRPSLIFSYLFTILERKNDLFIILIGKIIVKIFYYYFLGNSPNIFSFNPNSKHSHLPKKYTFFFFSLKIHHFKPNFVLSTI